MITYFKLIRIPNLIIATLAVLVATYSIKGHDLLLLLYAIISVVCTMSFGNILNDVLDLYSDKISHPSRPLPMNHIEIDMAKNIVFILLISILIISLFLNILASICLLCIILPLLICYNLYFILHTRFFVFQKSIFDYLSSDEDCDFEVGPLEQLTQDDQLMVYHHKGDWACMDTYRDSVFLNDLWKNGKAFWNA